MILSLIILLLMIINIYNGFREGLVYEFIRVISYFIGWMIALVFMHPLSMMLHSFLNLDSVLLNGLSFLIILIIAVWALKSIGRMINRLTNVPVIKQLNAVGGAIVGAFVGYLIIFILLNVCLALPSDWLHQEYFNSPVALKIVNHTPGITNHLMSKWLK